MTIEKANVALWTGKGRSKGRRIKSESIKHHAMFCEPRMKTTDLYDSHDFALHFASLTFPVGIFLDDETVRLTIAWDVKAFIQRNGPWESTTSVSRD